VIAEPSSDASWPVMSDNDLTPVFFSCQVIPEGAPEVKRAQRTAFSCAPAQAIRSRARGTTRPSRER
jgi:hypothetical protein